MRFSTDGASVPRSSVPRGGHAHLVVGPDHGRRRLDGGRPRAVSASAGRFGVHRSGGSLRDDRNSVSAATGTVVRAPTSDKLAPAAPPPGPVIRVTIVPVGPSPLVSPAPQAASPAAPAKPADAARPQPQAPAPAAVSAADFAASLPPKFSAPLPAPGADSASTQPAPARAARAPAQDQGRPPRRPRRPTLPRLRLARRATRSPAWLRPAPGLRSSPAEPGRRAARATRATTPPPRPTAPMTGSRASASLAADRRA